MDTEFINVYINKQKALIDKFQNEIIMSETKIEILQRQVSALQEEISKLKVVKETKK